MKINIKHLAILLSSALTFSCSSDEDFFNSEDMFNGERRIAVIAEDFTPTASTRTVYNERTDGTGYSFAWSEGDDIGIFPQNGTQIQFMIGDGAGTNTAVFDGGDWALKPNGQYMAYYPYSIQNVYSNPTGLPIDMTGQCQTGNNTTAHLSTYDYMAAAPVTSDNGSITFAFKHQVALLRLNLNLPADNKYYSVKLTSTSGEFITQGLMDITLANTTVTAEETSKSITLNFSEGIAAGSNSLNLTAYMMVLPVDLLGGDILIDVDDEFGNYYRATVKGTKFEKGKMYALEGTLSKLMPDFNGHEYVDLGIVVDGQKIFWATMNVGATSEIEPGDYFAWGETEPKYTSINEDGTLNLKPGNSVVYNGKTYEGYHPFNHKYFDFQAFVEDRPPFYTKYINDGKTVLDLEDDAAHVNWGGDWRMPTEKEAGALINMTGNYYYYTDAWTTNYQNTGTNGLDIYSTNEGYLGEHIFLPTTEWGYEDKTVYEEDVSFWTSTIHRHYHSYQTKKNYYENIVCCCSLIYITLSGVIHCSIYYDQQSFGNPVRAVCSIPVSPRYSSGKTEGFHENDYNW